MSEDHRSWNTRVKQIARVQLNTQLIIRAGSTGLEISYLKIRGQENKLGVSPSVLNHSLTKTSFE